MKKIIEKMKSDNAAALSGEMLMLIALAIFAGLALFRFVLKPIEGAAGETGKTITDTITELLGGRDPANATP